ncbi:ImcF-related family protein [Orbaceae bacterium ESL0721]|nr:ImcF-related family protein [Orbaceae bacterium ESL0721]
MFYSEHFEYWFNLNKQKTKKNIYQEDLFNAIKNRLFTLKGLFWRYKVRRCLVFGKQSEIAKLFPNLESDKWQYHDNTVIVYGGDLQNELNSAWLLALKKTFSRCIPFFHKPIDGLIWILPDSYLAESRQQQLFNQKGLQYLQTCNKLLNWSAPLYLVASQTSSWNQNNRVDQTVGVLFSQLNKEEMEPVVLSLNNLAAECSKRGVEQIKGNLYHDFLLRLSHNLVKHDIAAIKHFLTSIISSPCPPSIRGLFFVPTPFSETDSSSNENSATKDNALPKKSELLFLKNDLILTPTWQSISDDANNQIGNRVGKPWGVVLCYLSIFITMLLGIGLFTSYYRNQSLINNSIKLVKQADDSINQDYSTRLLMQEKLQQQIEQLIYRKQHGIPLSYRFGLNHNEILLNKLLSNYRAINSRNIATPFYTMLVNNLSQLLEMLPDDPRRAKELESTYDFLKAYLMISRPDKSDGGYLSQFASKKWQTPKGVNDGEWQTRMPNLVRFWGEMIHHHPKWAINGNTNLVNDIRQLLIGQIGVQNAVNTLYQEMIQRASQHYANQTLTHLLEGLDSRMLFSNDEVEVPGVFTRKAYEETIKDAIDSTAKSRKEQIDWVLSDGQNRLTSSTSPEILKQQLTELYFSDYSVAWLKFLNTIKWHQVNNVSDVIQQLTLITDTRQSPLIALMNVVKYESEVAYKGDGISDNIIRSAQELIKKKSPLGLPKNNEPSGPLTYTFSPVTHLLKNDNTNGLTLQNYLLKLTQVRLKLQNIVNSPDPKAMMQMLAKSVFKGTSLDLTETREYGNLIAANLGEEWSGFGYSLFKQPLEQAWHVVLQPASMSFNDTWQNNIASQWERSFAGRYPFKNSDNDASLAELARFIRADTGIIDRFITTELNGVLEKSGGIWVVNKANTEGLNFSPKFLDALKLFTELSSELLPSGDFSVSFDLMPRSGNKISRTELVIDKQKLVYFNQEPMWQRFNWPGEGYSAYSQLSWSGDNTGLRLYSYYSGDWAWLRLLESASVKRLDSSRYELVWSAPDKRKLRYVLRTQLGGGPLTLLKLRNFTLPKKVFE